VHVDETQDCVCAFITTSQLQFFKDNPQLESEIVRIEPGTISAFTKETAIDCRQAYEIRISKLDRLYAEGKLTPKGSVPVPIMQRVLDTVRSSRLLPRKLKRLLAT
jgi:hypothetical protein